MSSPWQQAVEIMETDALPLVIDADYVAVRFPHPQIPLKTNMEPKNGCLEDDFPFQFGWYVGSIC